MACCIDISRNQTSKIRFSSDSDHCGINESLCTLIKFCTPIISNHLYAPKSTDPLKISPIHDDDEDHIWISIQEEAKSDTIQEPILSNYYYSSILSHTSLESALSNHLAIKLGNASLPSDTLNKVFLTILHDEDSEMKKGIREDLKAARERDPACISYVHCLLNFKGFLACQAHRVAHKLWLQKRTALALVIQSRVSEVFAVDIHPGAKIGNGILIDHATGVVIGETAVIGDNVSILHNVTLGGTGKGAGDIRHPKIGDGVLIGAGAVILGNIKIGDGSKIGAASLVLKEVSPTTTVVGNPARVVCMKM